MDGLYLVMVIVFFALTALLVKLFEKGVGGSIMEMLLLDSGS